MIIIITGTPGTGKSTVSKLVAEKMNAKLISINSLLEEYNLNLGTDELRGYKIVDTESMIPIVDKIKEDSNELIIFEGHLAQDYPNADMIIVLRCDPLVLEKRLKPRNWPDRKVRENISSEILGICTSESYETYGEIVQELDTTDTNALETADILSEIIKGEKEFPLGNIDYLEKYFTYL
ncbi:adenylate kinase family protein [Methanosphaera sp. WGK6]|uniref:adenylate kinase family protein n=1 Tax=Methanosphaera sp. WGK6 TaxID=1561964 RepID=UPI00084C0EED|nr:adenylate kinase family protein [Methanosphaera sp. WGK6]OED30190.1 hypothetical protein NL43_04240 [Methanosphaera sp. WGK6]